MLKGRIENMDTGEAQSFEHYLFCLDFEITTIVKILDTRSYEHFDSKNRFQVSVDCLGLTIVGSVFELELYYTPKTVKQRNRLIRDLTKNSIFMVKGGYAIGGMGTQESFVMIFDALYHPVEPDFSEDEIREVFRVNGKKWETITEP